MSSSDFKHYVGVIGDHKILRYRIPGWDQLSTKQHNLLWCLYKSCMYGRDIYYDQSFKYGLYIRRTLEAILRKNIDRSSDNEEWSAFLEYVGQFWMNSGIHNNTSGDKTTPKFTPEFFKTLLTTIDQLSSNNAPAGCDIMAIIFDPNVYPKKVTPDSIEKSSVNFYVDITTEQARAYHDKLEKDCGSDPEPPEFGLNSQLVRNSDGTVVERKWHVNGMYGPALKRCVEWLHRAIEYAETPEQAFSFQALIKYYESGDLKDFISYCKAWVVDTKSTIDMIHGFTETYDDPLGHRGSWECVVTVCDPIASKRIEYLRDNAQYFEDNSPVMPQHKRAVAKGIDARVVNVVCECGDAAPCTPIGVNLPNAEWFRSTHGSKSINMANICHAYDESTKEFQVGNEFYLPHVYELIKGSPNAGDIFTDMHEVLGHGSGQLEPNVSEGGALGGLYGILEEARADLFGLYYIMDPYVVQIGLTPNLDAGKALYQMEFTNGLIGQLVKVPAQSQTLTQTHMRDRQLIASWVFERANGAVIKSKNDEGKTFFEVVDYQKCRDLFGELLREVQRIKSQGDRPALEELIEKYATHIDPDMHAEALERFAKFKLPPFSGFIQPDIERDPMTGKITVNYPTDFTEQMLFYSSVYSTLPDVN